MSRSTILEWARTSTRLRRFANWPGSYPAILLVIGALTYLFALPSLGFFWDDWEVVFLLKSGDPQLFAQYFAFDRPFAWPYQVMYAIFGLNPFAWHVITLLARWGGILLLFYALLEIWPRQRSRLEWLGALLLVYPGFLQQSISGAYNRHFTAFLIFGLSIYLMVRAVRGGRAAWPLTIAACIAAFIHMFTIEYFVGLELLRPILLWLLVAGDEGQERSEILRRTLRLWLPYAALFVLYGWWRLTIFPSSIPVANYAADFKLFGDFSGSFLSGLLSVLTRAVLDLLYSTLQVWTSVLGQPDTWTFQGKIAWVAFGLGTILAFGFSFLWGRSDDTSPQASGLPRSFVVTGLWAFIASGLPVWLTSKQFSSQGRWDDRFSLAPMLGACMLVIWLMTAVIRARAQRALLAVLLALSIATQVIVVNRYRLDWTTQNAYYWQLAWRIPALEPGTAIISFEQPSASIPGYDASFAMNLLFDGRPDGADVPYWFFTNDRFLNFELRPEKAISYKDRNLRFRGNTSDAIAVVHQGENRCLQVLDSVFAEQPFYAADQEQLVSLSNTSRILRVSDKPGPDTDVFGPEPAHTWCYYFQKADLARQYGDWDTVLQLEQKAQSEGYAPGFGPEFLPFVEAHAQQGDWKRALELSQQAQESTSEMEPLLCSTWTRLGKLPSIDLAVLETARAAFSCSGQ